MLLDTQIFLWAILDDARMTLAKKRIYVDPENDLLLSMVSLWEIFLKVSTGKLSMEDEPETFVRSQLALNRIALLPIRLEHTAQVMRLPWHHKDPFDRLLIAQAQIEGLPVMTSDAMFEHYEVTLVS